MKVLRAGLLLLVGVALPASSRAGGFHYPELGTVGLSRGGAFVATADDPTAIYYNPAGAARIVGTQILLSGNLLNETLRFQRRSYEDPTRAPDRYPNDPTQRMPEVVNSDGWFPAPFFAVTSDLHVLRPYRIVLMAGIYGPNAHNTRTMPRYCKPGSNPCEPVDKGQASPARYETVSTELLVLYPTFGAAWRPIKSLSLGAVLQLGYNTMTYKTVVAGLMSENPDTDVEATLNMSSGISPTGIFGVHWAPLPFLELGASVRIGFTFHATGQVCMGTKEAGKPCQGLPKETVDKLPLKIRLEPNPAPAHMDIPKAWVVRTGARYVHRDGEGKEKADVELNFVWENTSRLKSFLFVPDQPIKTVLEETGETFTQVKELAEPYEWQNSWSLRLGGSYRFHRIFSDATLILRAGGFYEAPAQKDDYVRLAFMPFERGGFTLGGGLRWRRYAVDVGYAHIFNKTVTIAPPAGAAECTNTVTENCGSNVRQMVPLTSAPIKFGSVIGNGTYAAAIDEITLGASVVFDGP
ncbi:MAG: outer membrane protein transport protein [Deltaproteobacteria bacterium]|nr:outer membrane protein transport protein [Deltaproteobacteria bacterium]